MLTCTRWICPRKFHLFLGFYLINVFFLEIFFLPVLECNKRKKISCLIKNSRML